MLLRLAYLTMTNAFAALRLLPRSGRDKDVEILALRHQLAVLERQLHEARPRFTPEDRTFLAALLHHLPKQALCQVRLLVRTDTVLRWHRDILRRQHAMRSRPKRIGRPRTVRSIRLLVLRLAKDNPTWGYRRIHGELAVLGVKVAASTIWEILRTAGIDPAPQRTTTTWAAFLHSQADALLACDFLETVTLTGARLHVLTVIEQASRRIRILGATAHPTAAWVTQAARNLVMDLEDAGYRARFLIRDRDGKYPQIFDAILADAGIQAVLTGVRMPRMNAVMERWVATCRRELLDRTLIWNQRHLTNALREFENHYNTHRPHRALDQSSPLRARPTPINDPDRIAQLNIRRHDRLGGTLHEYRHIA
ncbi:integrase core domain-containing protein [Streptomyces silvisoli]|uniref:Integrase core domain-containing protein n=1 Tax=Streptomyces silvisoli TaxID=3034235 RepID=A0ABT5ZX61_9ACTN|nr:integrase core domain-containing protein [Streptomyces silvisoli]MDF3294412.1 integrase core domain-containing protein [Streptomyces silvisoli]